jgi:glycosyltransferase involved in cell wall biosynthesis
MSDKPKVSGWTLTRNCMRAGYPIVESILAVLPLCDEFIVMNDSQDSTGAVLEQMRRKYGKIRVVNRPWLIKEYRDHSLAVATDWGLSACGGEWLIYVQADEIFSQDAIPRMKSIIENPIDETGCPIQAVQFHRMQLKVNFQENCGEHAVIRMAKKGAIQACGDALSFAVLNDDYFCFDKPGEFSLFDITRCFASSIPAKAYGQAEIWHHLPNRNAAGWWGRTPEEWCLQIDEWEKSGYPEIWTRKTSPFMGILPDSMKRHIGEVRYIPHI